MKPLSNITKLHTRPDRLKTERAAELKQMLLEFEMPDQARDALLYTIDRQTKSDRKDAFVMLSPAQNIAVVNHLLENSKRPLVAVKLWALCFDHLYPNTGQIMLTREELAEKIGDTPKHVSEIMGELVTFGAIFAKRVKVGGMRGPGMVQYSMNPHVAEYGNRRSAEELAQIPLPGFEPKVIEGGKS